MKKVKFFVSILPQFMKFYYSKLFGYPDIGFHCDRIFRNCIKELFKSLPLTSFVETGTYLGDSTLYTAKINNQQPIFSCEINGDLYNIVKKRLRRFKNVYLTQSNSPEFLRSLIKRRALGHFPLFFLDAHWYDYWPLEEELEIITNGIKKAIIIIDDFEVFGQPQFDYDIGGGKKLHINRERIDQRVCGLKLIMPRLNRNNSYNVLLPRYSRRVALNLHPITVPFYPLRGYIIIFQNCVNEFEVVSKRIFFTHYYFSDNKFME